MTITTAVYTPDTQPYSGEDYSIIMETSGSDSVEVWYIDADNNRTRASTDRYVLTFKSGEPPIYDVFDVKLTKPAPEGTVTLSFERNTPITQLLDFNNFEPFPMKMLEYTLDKHMMICQELAYRKCNADVGDLEMTQLVSFDPYTPFYAVELNAQLQKTYDILEAIANSADLCVSPVLEITAGIQGT